MIRLNLGCGKDILEDYDNIDIRKLHHSVIIADVCNLPYELESVDEIRAIDIYEHISFLKSEELINHWVSLLKPGGKLVIQTTDSHSLANMILKSSDIRQTEESIRRIFGGQEYEENTHKTIGDINLLKFYLFLSGVRKSIKVYTGFGNGTNFKIVAIK